MQPPRRPSADLARHLRELPAARVSLTATGLVLALHAAIAVAGGPDHCAWWFGQFGLERDAFLSGKWWQPASYGLLHGSWWHAGLNAGLLLALGSRIEHMAGRAAVLRALAAGVPGGGLFHLLLGDGLLVGSSGACMLLLLLLATLSPQSRMLPLPVSARSLGLGVMAAALLLALMNPALGLPGLAGIGRMLGGAWFQIGHACHFGGGLAGWLLGRWVLRPRVSLAKLQRERERRERQ